jgi:hypothetical protein
MGAGSNFVAILAATVDLAHGLVMVAWGLGLPLLFWHRFPRLSRGYMWFALSFVILSVASQELLGECFLTRIARELWLQSGGYRGREPFTVLFANAVAGIRPTAREAVLVWEVAVFVTSAASLWCWRGTRRVRGQRDPRHDPCSGRTA